MVEALPMPSTVGQPWRDISDRAPQGAATASIFGAGDSVSLRLCLYAASNVHDSISSLIVFELGWVTITVLLILYSLNSLHMELPLVLPVVTCWFFLARGLDREGGAVTCQLRSNCSVAVLPPHLLVVILNAEVISAAATKQGRAGGSQCREWGRVCLSLQVQRGRTKSDPGNPLPSQGSPAVGAP